MTTLSLLRLSLIGPLLLPIPAWLLAAVMPTELTVALALFALGTLIFAGLPYALVALRVSRWAAHQPVQRLRRCAPLFPLLAAPAIATLWTAGILLGDQPPAKSPLVTWASVTAIGIVLGELYVLIVLAAEGHLRRRGVVEAS